MVVEAVAGTTWAWTAPRAWKSGGRPRRTGHFLWERRRSRLVSAATAAVCAWEAFFNGHRDHYVHHYYRKHVGLLGVPQNVPISLYTFDQYHRICYGLQACFAKRSYPPISDQTTPTIFIEKYKGLLGVP